MTYPRFITLLYFSSFLYTVKLFLSPVYFLVTALLLFFIKSHKTKVIYLILLTLIVIFIIANGLPLAYLANALLGGLSLIFIISSTKKLYPSINIAESIKKLNVILVFIFTLELLIRFSIISDNIIQKYFQLKYNSFMFADSNTTAFAIFSVIAIEVFLLAKNIRKSRFLVIILFFLLILTLSKSLIFFSIIFYFYHFQRKYFMISFAILPIWLIDFYDFISQDSSIFLIESSLITRADMWTSFFYYLNQASISQLLIGAGWEDFRYDLYADEPHSFFISLLGVGGFLSLFLGILLIIYAYISSKRFSKYYLSTLFFASLVYVPYYGLIFMFVTYAVLFLLERDKSYV